MPQRYLRAGPHKTQEDVHVKAAENEFQRTGKRRIRVQLPKDTYRPRLAPIRTALRMSFLCSAGRRRASRNFEARQKSFLTDVVVHQQWEVAFRHPHAS